MFAVPALAVLLLAGPLSPPSVAQEPLNGDYSAQEQALNEALQAYFGGDIEAARTSLQALASDPSVKDPELRHRILLYLGEVQYVMTEWEASFGTFLSILLDDPEYVLDPFEHPPDVRAHFEDARATALEILETTNPPPPSPVKLSTIVAPGGLQFRNGQTTLGYATLFTVGVLGVSATTLNIAIRLQDQEPGWGIQIYSREQEERLRTLKTWQNVTATTTGLLWAAATVQGLSYARRLEVALGPSSATLSVRW